MSKKIDENKIYLVQRLSYPNGIRTPQNTIVQTYIGYEGIGEAKLPDGVRIQNSRINTLQSAILQFDLNEIKSQFVEFVDIKNNSKQ